MDEKFVNKIGWFAAVMAISMYFSYIDQIILNVSGQKGSIILPMDLGPSLERDDRNE